MSNEINYKLINFLVIFGIILSINNTILAQDWNFEIKLSKQSYILHEKIWLDATITNITSESIRTNGIVAPNHLGFIIEIKDNSGNIIEYTGPVWSFASGPGTYLIKSGEYQYKCFDLLKSFGDIKGTSGYLVQYQYFPFLPIGNYTVQAQFEGVTSNEQTFDVIEPIGTEKEALELMVDAWSLWKQRDNDPSGRKYQEIIDKFPNSVYAETCLENARVYTDNTIEKYFREGIAYDKIGLYKELLQKFPNSGNSIDWLNAIIHDMDQAEKEKVINKTLENHPNTRIAKFAKQMLLRMPKKVKQ